MQKQADNPDKVALKKMGAAVRDRLEADPQAYKVPIEAAEIWAVGDFLSADECRRFREMIDIVAKPSELFEEDYASGFRTSYSGNFSAEDPLIKGVSRRIDDLLGVPTECGETIQGQRYLPGQEFKPHNDYFFPGQKHWELERKRGGQRSWTAMAFLNNVEDGGETQFVKAEIMIPPKEGVLLIWNNALPDGTPNEGTLHAGTPVRKGEKYVLTKWYRTRKWG